MAGVGQEKPNRFIDYFVICGLDETSELEPDRLAGKNECLYLRINPS